MDPELKAALEAIHTEMQGMRERMTTIEGRMATKSDLEQMNRRLADRIDESDRQNRVLHGETQRQVRAIAEGHQILAEHIDRQFEEHDRRWDERVQPIEAAVRVNSDDLRAVKHDLAGVRSDVADLRRAAIDHEARISALERQRGSS